MLSDEPFLGVVNETNRILGNALDEGILDNIPPEEMLRALRNDVFVFSGLKAHAELKEASELLLTTDGKIKPFSQFKADVLSVHQDYNVRYLEPEYIFATSSAQMAAKWVDFEKDGDRYNLQYRTAGDNKVRDDHAALANITLPSDDAFWDSYLPPIAWRCRCTAVQVRKGKYPEDNSAKAIAKGEEATTKIDKKGNNSAEIFRFNPGKQKVIFPPHHPYRKVQERVRKIVESLGGEGRGWENIETEKGSVRVSVLHGAAERESNLITAKYLANTHGYDIELLPVVSNKKTADSFNKTLNQKQEYKTNIIASKGAIDNEIRDAARQADHIVIRVTSGINDNDLQRGIKGRVNQEKSIKSITVIRNGKDKSYTRDDIMKKDFNL